MKKILAAFLFLFFAALLFSGLKFVVDHFRAPAETRKELPTDGIRAASPAATTTLSLVQDLSAAPGGEIMKQTIQAFFIENFQGNQVLEEADKIENSANKDWFLTSGGRFYFNNGVGSTIKGNFPAGEKWYEYYNQHHADDTDGGKHPQNIFRLATKTKWKNFYQQFCFRITGDNLSESQNRNASNGALQFIRYQDQNNLYYTGIRVDGAAVIKKKMAGEYYTLDYAPFFSRDKSYDRAINVNFLPKNSWMGIKSEVETKNGSVSIKFYVDRTCSGNWELAAQAVDDGSEFGAIFDAAGYGGIRTDFMDVEFDNYSIEEIKMP